MEQSQALKDIAAERQRQIESEGWSVEHDDAHTDGSMALAAAAYARAPEGPTLPPLYWPWSRDWWKPKSRRSNLVRAGALIAAEIERLDRAETEHDR